MQDREPFTNADRAREYFEMGRMMRQMGNEALASNCFALALQLRTTPDMSSPEDLIKHVLETMMHDDQT